MYSLFVCSFENIRRIILWTLIPAAFACNKQMTSGIKVSPRHFKIQTPFMLSSRGIIVNTYWGNEKKHHVLCLDNYSPSWIKSSVIEYNKWFSKAENLGFKTSTADGSRIQGDVGICDILFFENIVFTDVPFYVMPDNPSDNKNDDGV